MITIRNKKEMEEYYIEEINTYVFSESVEFTFDVEVDSHINAHSIYAKNIKAHNIKACEIEADDIEAWNIEGEEFYARNINAWNIVAFNIDAYDITYYAVCVAENNIECNSIKGRHTNAKHFVLDGELIIKGE